MKKLKKTSVLPHLDTSHQRKQDGKSRFYLKVRANGTAKLYDITPELYMDKKFWVHEVDVETKQVRKRMRIAHAKGNNNSRNIEQTLVGKLNEMTSIINDIESAGNGATHDQLALRWRTISAKTLCDLIEMRIEDESRHLSQGSIEAARSFLGLLSAYDNEVLLLNVNQEWLRGFENHLRYERVNKNTGEKGLKQNTVVTNFKQLRKYLRFAHLNGFIQRNPMATFFGDSTTVKRFGRVTPKTETLTALEIDLLHTAFVRKVLLDEGIVGERLHETLQAMLTSVYTGFRISDIKQIYNAANFTVTDNHITLTMNKVKREISIKITNRLREVIQLEEGKPLLEGRPYKVVTMNYKLRDVLKHFGIHKHLTWHDLRRTFATQLQANKVDIKRISKLLGHTSVVVTELYVKVRNEDLDKAMDSWDQLGNGNQESEEVADVLDEVAAMVKLNPGLQVSEKLLEMLSGRIPESAGIWKVS